MTPNAARRARGLVAPLLGLGGMLALAASSTLWDRDEPRFARATVEMVASGDYLVPTFNGALRPDKPAGIYWLMAAAAWLLGPSELAFRLPSIAFMALGAWATGRVGRRLFGPRTGNLACAYYATALMPIYIGSAATADGVLNGCLAVAWLCAVELACGGRPWRPYLGVALALGVAQLVKGPVGLVLPTLSAALAAALAARHGVVLWPRATGLGLVAAAVASVAPFAAWGLPADARTGGELAARGLGYHVLARATTALDGHGGRDAWGYLAWLPFYLPVVLVGFLPWSPRLPAALAALWHGRLGGARERALVWGAMIPPFVVMTLVVTRLPHYVLPGFPALAVLVAAVVDRADPRDASALRLGARVGGALAVLGASGGAIAVALRSDLAPLVGPAFALAGVVVATAVAAWRRVDRADWAGADRATHVGMGVAITVLAVWAIPAYERLGKGIPTLAAAVRAEVGTDAPVAVHELGEPSLVHYLDRPWGRPVLFLEDEHAVVAWDAIAAPGVLVIPRERLLAIASVHTLLSMDEVARVRVLDHTRGRWLELVAVRRRTGR